MIILRETSSVIAVALTIQLVFMVCESTTAFTPFDFTSNASKSRCIKPQYKQDRSLVLCSQTSQDVQSDMRDLGTQMILAAAIEAGATEPMVEIDWKGDRIIVTIDVNADESYINEDNIVEDELEDEIFDIDEDDFIDEDDLALLDFDDEEDSGFVADDDSSGKKVDVTKIARVINEYLSRDGEGSLGDKIAQIHEIEVTTPEFDNVLRGARMFQVYKGFDVVVEHWQEPKKKKGKTVSDEEVAKPKLVTTEGKLVGRDKEKNITTINVKGRNMKIKNELIESVMLPKAKREKGAK